MMLLVLGMQLSQADRPATLPAVGTATIARLLVAPVLAFAGAALVGLSGAARQAAILQASTPTAVITTILAVEYAVAPRFVTSGRRLYAAQPGDAGPIDRLAAVGRVAGPIPSGFVPLCASMIDALGVAAIP